MRNSTCLLICCFVFVVIASFGAPAHADGPPNAAQSEPPPKKEWVVYAPYWSAEGKFQTTLHLHNNHVSDLATAQVEIYSAEGVLLASREVQLAPLMSVSMSLSSLIDSNQPGSRHGGVALRYRAAAASAVQGTLSVTDEHHSLSFHVPFLCGQAGSASQVLESAWWFPFPNTQGQVVLFNASDEEIAVTPTLLIDGAPYELQPRSIPPKASGALDLHQALGPGLGAVTHGGLRLAYTGAPNALRGVVLLYDERRGFSDQVRLWGHDLFHRDTHPVLANPGVFTLNAPFVMLGKPPAGAGFAPGTSFTPWLLLRNTTDENLALDALFTYMESGAPVQVPLPVNILFPQQTLLINLDQFVAQGIIPRGVGMGAVSVSYEGYFNSVLMNIASLDLTGNFVQGAAISVDGAPRVAGAYWRTDGDYNTMVTVQNVDTDATTVRVTVVLEDGNRYRLPPVELAPKAITQFDLEAIQRQAQPDDEGRLWPATVMTGGLRIESEDGRRMLAVDVAVFNTVLGTCEIPPPICSFCAGVLAIVLLPPDLVGTVGQTQQLNIRADWSDGTQQTMGADSYFSSNQPVISVNSSGMASLNNVGTSSLRAEAFLPVAAELICDACPFAIFRAIDDGDVITVSQSPPPPPELKMSTGDTMRQITVMVNPANVSATRSFTTTFTNPENPANPNPDSSCQVSLSIPALTGQGNTMHTITASPAGCSGVFSTRATANGVQSSNTTTVQVPPQILIKMINGEAGGQDSPTDTSQRAVGVAARNRFGDATFFNGATNYQNTITPGQFAGLNLPAGQIANGPEPELSNAVQVWLRQVGNFISPAGGTNSQCFFSPTAAQWQTIQQALQNNSTNPADVPNPTGCYSGAPTRAQIRIVSTVANNADGRGAPAFVFQGLRPSAQDPVVISIQ